MFGSLTRWNWLHNEYFHPLINPPSSFPSDRWRKSPAISSSYSYLSSRQTRLLSVPRATSSVNVLAEEDPGMLIPIGHENMSARRWPIITIALIVINVAVFLGTHGAMEEQAPELGHTKAHILMLAAMHPELNLPPEA